MSSIVGLELPNAWRTSQSQNNTFDISADQLNNTLNRELFAPTTTIDWAARLHKNALDPVDDQDLATKVYVDINGGSLWSTFAAIQNVNMDSFKLENLPNPTNPQDSATKDYVDNNAGAKQLTDLTDVDFPIPLADGQFLQFNQTSGQWENIIFSPGAGSSIVQGDSSVVVVDTGLGVINFTVDNILRMDLDANDLDIKVPIIMNSQQIKSLGTPSDNSDAATKAYVDTEIANAGIKTDLDSLTDVTISSVAVNQIIVNNGTGQFINQLITKGILPTEIAYEDEVNNFTLNQQFPAGLSVGADQNVNLLAGFMSNIRDATYNEQVSDPPTPILTDSTMFLDVGTDFNSPDPIFAVLIDRGGTIEKKPVVTSETVFALRNFSNGMFTQETGVRLLTDGGIGIRVQLFNENDVGGSYEVVLDGNIFTIQDPVTGPSVSNTIDISVGTDIAAVKHFVWIQVDLGVPTMTSSTVEFPSTGDFAVVGTFLLQSQASVLADGAYAVNSPDYEVFDEASRGHLAHINDNLVSKDAQYNSGIDITVTPAVGGGTLTEVTYTSTSGVSQELHLETIEAFDISTGIALVENDAAQTALEVTRVVNLSADLLGMTCGNGVDIMYASNNDTANIVVYTIHSDEEPNHTNYGINLPFEQYTNDDAAAIADSDGFAIKNVPLNVRGITLLIAEIVIKFTTGGNYEVLAVKDLRGQIPGATGGAGGGGGGGAEQLNDLTDVTISTALINQSIVNDGAGQFVNRLIPLLETSNVWTNFQDLTAIADPGDTGSPTIGRLFTEAIDGTNLGLFIYLIQDGIQRKVRLA